MSALNVRIIIDAVTDGLRNGVNSATTLLGDMRSRVTAIFTSIHTLIALGLTSAMVNAAVEIARSFDVINASIKTATKGLQNEAIPALKDFAKTTPYDLEQVSEAFVNLVNFGLTPSEAALRSYGNTASAMGKDLNQMVEAVADAVTGEFERLKEFGIQSKTEGDNVIFTFQGVSTSVKNNAANIEKYLLHLGDVNFAGAMADRSKTLDGALSNLSDSYHNLVLTVMNSGFSDFIAESSRSASESLDGISKYIESGVLQANIATITTSFDGMAKDVVQSMGITTAYIKQQFSEWSASGTESAHTLTTEFQAWLNNTRSFIQIMVVEAASMWDKIKILSDSSLQSMRKPMEAQQEKLEGINKARQDSIASILDEHAAQKIANKDAIDANDAIVASLEREAAAHKKNETDRLAKFKIGGTSTSDNGSSTSNDKKTKSPKAPAVESEMHGFEFGLEQQKIAFQKKNALLDFSKQAEKAYWDDIIANYKGNDKTLAELKKKSADLELQILRDNAQKSQELLKEKQQAEYDLANDQLAAKQDEAQQQYNLGVISQAELLNLERQYAQESYQIALKLAKQKRDLTLQDTVARAQAENDILQVIRDGAKKDKDLANQQAVDKKNQFKEQFAPLENALDQSVNGILTGQQTIKNATKNAAQSIVVSYAAAFIKKRTMAVAEWAWEALGFAGVEAKKKAIKNAGFIWDGILWAKKKVMLAAGWAWETLGFGAKEATNATTKIVSEGVQTGAQVTGDVIRTGSTIASAEIKDAVTEKSAKKSIFTYALEAAAAAYNSAAAIPYVGWILGPLAAAAAFVGVMAFGNQVGSAKGGEWQVGEDGSPYILHENESVLPAGVADNFRKVVEIVKGSTGFNKTNNLLPPNTAELIDQLMSSGAIAKRLSLPQPVINLAASSADAATGFARDQYRVKRDEQKAAYEQRKKTDELRIHTVTIDDFFTKHGGVMVKVAGKEARKFNGGKK